MLKTCLFFKQVSPSFSFVHLQKVSIAHPLKTCEGLCCRKDKRLGEAAGHTSVCLTEAGEVISVQAVGGRERWASEGLALIGDLVWSKHTHTGHMIDGPPLTAALDEASARWLMVALAHRSSSFHDLKTFALMHPHKRELWWAPRNSQIWALTLFPVYRRDAVQKPGCVFAILIFSVRPQVLCFGALQ